MNYYNKYLKYKNKYINLTNMIGSGNGELSCSKCINPELVKHLHTWHTGSCDKCLTKTKKLGLSKELSTKAINAQSYKDNLVQQCIDNPDLKPDDICFSSIPKDIIADVRGLLNDLSEHNHKKLIDYYTNNPLLLKYINVQMLHNYKINFYMLVNISGGVNIISSHDVDTSLYIMKYDEDNLPMYPSEGSIEREKLKNYLLAKKKIVYKKNIEVLQIFIFYNKLHLIKRHILDQHGLLEFVNTYILSYYKERPMRLYENQSCRGRLLVPGYDENQFHIYENTDFHEMKYDENNLPPYPSEGSVQREEIKKLILSTQKEVYEQNRHQIKEFIKRHDFNTINCLRIKNKDLLEFINAHVLAYYKENLKSLTRKVILYQSDKSLYVGYVMKYNEKILPVYPSEGSVEREKMPEIILSAKKWAEEENIETITLYIEKKGVDLYALNHSKVHENKNLLEIVNKVTLDKIKEDPYALMYDISRPGTKPTYKMKYDEYNLPEYPYPSEGSVEKEELKKFILSTKRWVRKENSL